MASLKHVTRENVLAAIEECDRLGVAEFLDAHGYRPSLKYQIRHLGRSYPSKAILGVAAGLSSQEFFGGAAATVRVLTRLGFQVRAGERVVTALGLAQAAKEAIESEGVETLRQPELPVEPACYFASGSNNPAEIRGLAQVGQDVGVAAQEISDAAEEELKGLAGTDIQVFVDSGAFSEVEFGPGGPRVVEEITHDEWLDRLGLYERLADALGDQAWLVAPDQIGNQDVTLERLARYRENLERLSAKGARILVPIQKGRLSQADFAGEVDAVLGKKVRWLPALPCKKAATTAAELEAFLAARPRTKHVHLLGLGVRNRNAADYVSKFEGRATSCSLDSNWICANVGRERGSVRPYTRAQDIAGKLIASGRAWLATKKRELAFLISFGLAGVLAPTPAQETEWQTPAPVAAVAVTTEKQLGMF